MQTALDPNGPWGLYDLRDRLWLGNDAGAYRYADEEMARVAATIATRRFRRAIRARLVPPGPQRLVDEVTPEVSAARAMRELKC